MKRFISGLVQGAKRRLFSKPATLEVPISVSGSPDVDAIVGQTNAHNEPSIRRFQTEVVGDLHEPRLGIEYIAPAWITTFGVPALLFVLHSYVWMAIAFLVLAFAWGIRSIPTVHNGLLYMLGRRYPVGFWEGFTWIPWMLGGKLKMINIELFSYEIPREDCWTTDQMHVVYDIVMRFGVRPVTEKGALTNFFWFFHWWRKTDTYEDYAASGAELGESLNNFMLNADVLAALSIAESHAKQATRNQLRGKSVAGLFQFTGQAYQADANAMSVDMENEIVPALNTLIANVGIIVTNFSLADLDFHDSAAAIFEKKLLASVQAEAELLATTQRMEIAEKLMVNPKVGEAALKAEIVRALNAAAEKGILGLLLQNTVLEKVFSQATLPVSDEAA